jgi:hypothetical protein
VPPQKHQQVPKRVIDCIPHSNPYTPQSELQKHTSHSVDQQRFIYLSRITSTRTNNNKTLQRSRVHIPVTHINVDKHKQQHTATQSCHSNNNNKSQRRHVNEGILHSAHTHHNRNRNNIFKLRNSHSSLFPPIIKGNTYPSRYVDKIQQQQHAVTQP